MLKLIIEFGPLLVFLISYNYSNIFIASLLMLSVTAICLIMSYFIDKKLSIPLVVSCTVLMLSGAISWFSGDAKYIKMKPTIVYLIFAITLYIGANRNRAFIKDLLHSVFKLPHIAWLSLSKRFAYFLFAMALINEIVWRNFTESTWVNFKIFGAIPLTMLFILTQLPFINSHRGLLQ